MRRYLGIKIFFFFNDTATTEIYTLSLHDALPIYRLHERRHLAHERGALRDPLEPLRRSEEHTSELQSRPHLVCRLLLEKKKEQPDQEITNHLNATGSLLPTRLFSIRTSRALRMTR